jgi:hypothetical protein
LVDPAIRPEVMNFCRNKNKSTVGNAERIAPAVNIDQSFE